MAIDTLGLVETLERARFPKAQARAVAKGLRDHIVPQLATKRDLDRLLVKIIFAMLAVHTLGIGVLALILR